MSTRDINNKFWNEELETMPREELEKNQLEDLCRSRRRCCVYFNIVRLDRSAYNESVY